MVWPCAMGAPLNSMNMSPPPKARCCEKVFTPVIRPCWTKSGDSIRYSMLCSPTLTASGSTAGRPWSARRCWKSTPFDVATQGSTARVPRKWVSQISSPSSAPGIRGTANSGVSPLKAQMSPQASALG